MYILYVYTVTYALLCTILYYPVIFYIMLLYILCDVSYDVPCIPVVCHIYIYTTCILIFLGCNVGYCNWQSELLRCIL